MSSATAKEKLLAQLLEWDNLVAGFFHRNFKNPKWNYTLSRINRGEVLAIILIPFLWWKEQFAPFWLHFSFLLLWAYATDRTVLFIKKWASRKRPLLNVLGKVDSNPDMKHSFPSAHSANSAIVMVLLVFGYHSSPIWLMIPLLAGLGRLITLHHYLSDVVGGWVLGCTFGILAVLSKPIAEELWRKTL